MTDRLLIAMQKQVILQFGVFEFTIRKQELDQLVLAWHKLRLHCGDIQLGPIARRQQYGFGFGKRFIKRIEKRANLVL